MTEPAVFSDDETVTIAVAGPPVPKGRPRFSRKAGIAYTPAKTRKYEDVVRLAAGQAMENQAPFQGPLAVEVEVYLPVPTSWSKKKQGRAHLGLVVPTKRPDANNFASCALDGCNGIVYRDDSQVVELHVTKRYAMKPQLIIRVRQIRAEAA